MNIKMEIKKKSITNTEGQIIREFYYLLFIRFQLVLEDIIRLIISRPLFQVKLHSKNFNL